MKVPLHLTVRVHWLRLRTHLALRLVPPGARVFGRLRQEADALAARLDD